MAIYPGPTSSNFPHSELACGRGSCIHCGGRNGVTQHHLNMLQTVRDMYGIIVTTSNYRCPLRNAEIGSKPNSYHVYGMASDIIRIGDMFAHRDEDRKKMITILEAAGFWCLDEGGWIHADLRYWITRHP